MTGLIMRRDLWFVCAFLPFVLILLPLRVTIGSLGLTERGLAAREATGSLWSGRLRDAQWGPARFGDAHVGLQIGPLLLGRAVLAAASAGTRGRVVATPWSFGFSGVHATLDTPISSSLPFTGLQLEDLAVHFAGERCAEASGLVRAQTSAEYVGVSLRQSLTGIARCEGPLLLIPLVSVSGMEAVHIKIAATGRYEADMIVRPIDPAIASILEASGFRRTGRGYVMRRRGSLQGYAQ